MRLVTSLRLWIIGFALASRKCVGLRRTTATIFHPIQNMRSAMAHPQTRWCRTLCQPPVEVSSQRRSPRKYDTLGAPAHQDLGRPKSSSNKAVDLSAAVDDNTSNYSSRNASSMERRLPSLPIASHLSHLAFVRQLEKMTVANHAATDNITSSTLKLQSIQDTFVRYHCQEESSDVLLHQTQL